MVIESALPLVAVEYSGDRMHQLCLLFLWGGEVEDDFSAAVCLNDLVFGYADGCVFAVCRVFKRLQDIDIEPALYSFLLRSDGFNN
jgi:hypothetical protein